MPARLRASATVMPLAVIDLAGAAEKVVASDISADESLNIVQRVEDKLEGASVHAQGVVPQESVDNINRNVLLSGILER